MEERRISSASSFQILRTFSSTPDGNRREFSSALAEEVVEDHNNIHHNIPLLQQQQPDEIVVTSTRNTKTVRKGNRLEELRKRLKSDSTNLGSFSSSSSSSCKPKKKEEEVDNSKNIYEILERIAAAEPSDATRRSMVLTDRYKRHHSYLRISLSERCNLRCQYCMPPEGVPLQADDKLLQRDEILKLARIFAMHGVDKVRLTGGEPLLRKDVVEIIRDLNSIPGIRQIGMTTNGITLKRKLKDLVDAGLSHINISLDTLKEDKFLHLTRRPGLNKVLQSIEAASELLPPNRVKINNVVMRNTNEEELRDFCLLTRTMPVDVRFIEWMPFFDNGWSQDNGLVPYQEMLDIVQSKIPLQRVEDGPNDTTKWWKLQQESSMGRIGFITSMSNHFCGTCNRLRLTADGQIKVCLFGSNELSLRDALRDPTVTTQDIERLIHFALSNKHFALGGHGTPQNIADANDNRPMTLIGG